MAIDRMSMQIQNRAQRKLIENHRQTIREIESINKESQTKLETQSAMIAKRIAARSKEFMQVQYPKTAPPPTGMETYANAYTASVSRMRAANKLYIAEAGKMEVKAAMGPSG